MALESFVRRSFAPVIGSLTSNAADIVCQKNNLSFVQLLEPFCNVSLDYTLKDPSGIDLSIKNLKVCIKDVNEPLPITRDNQMLLNGAVADAWCDVTKQVRTLIAPLDIPVECPWFDAWSDALMRVQNPSDHEFTKHLLGCLLVTSANESLEIIQTMLETLRIMQTPSRQPKWFCPAIFKFFIIVCDNQIHDKSKAETYFEAVKSAYGVDCCFFLELNTRAADENCVANYWMDKKKPLLVSEPVYEPIANDVVSDGYHPLSSNQNTASVDGGISDFGCQLSSKDIICLEDLVRYVVRNALLPHVEKQIYILNDLVANKKGVSRSLLSATKRLFSSPRPVSGAMNTTGFPADAPELQLRRLGDLYFLFGSYANAFQAYYAAKRELGMEQAWLYYAGALEMAALSAFLLPDPPKKAVEYAEEAIVKYVSSRQQLFAVRATLFSLHCLKQKKMFSEAARQLTRMASEEDDLRSALYLEQAAYCLLSDKKPRKYAMHMVLAAHRFTKARQPRHALRCARQALQIYDGRGWTAEDHIYWSIGLLTDQLYKQRNADVSLLPEGLRSLSQLLVSCSRQEASQQANYLLGFLNMYQLWQAKQKQGNFVKLPLPVVEDNSASVRIAQSAMRSNERHVADSPENAARWARMEELALAESPNGVPMIFRPSFPVLTKHMPNPHGLTVAVNETIQVQVALRNPLHISLPLTQIELLWNWTGLDGKNVQSMDESTDTVAKSGQLASLLIPPDATQIITLTVVALREGILHITGFAYSLTTAAADTSVVRPPVVRGWHELLVRGPKLRPPKDRPEEECFAEDKRLHVTILPAAPHLSAAETSFRIDVLTGEIKSVPLDLTNSGNVGLKSLYAVTDAGNMLALPQTLLSTCKLTNDADTKTKYQVMSAKLDNAIEPSGKLPIELWVRSPDRAGPTEFRMLLVYLASGVAKHRVLRVILRLHVTSGLQISATLTSRPDEQGLTAIACISAANHHNNAVSLSKLVLSSTQHSLQPLTSFPLQESTNVKHSEKCYLAYRVSCRSDPNHVPVVSSITFDTQQTDDALFSSISKLLLSLASVQQIVLGILWQTSDDGVLRSGLSLMDSVNVKPLKVDDGAQGIAKQENHVNNVSLYLSHSDHVLHSFAKTRLCLVKVDVSVVSSCKHDAKVHLNAAGQDGYSTVEALLYTPHAGTAFTWAGRARAVVNVPALGKASVSMLAAFTAPGTYDLAVRFTATLDDVPLPPLATSPLVVVDADKR